MTRSDVAEKSARPTECLSAVIDAAVTATGATSGWILRLASDDFVVEAVSGAQPSERFVELHRPLDGTAGYAASSLQPTAIRTRWCDDSNNGAGGFDGIPPCILAVPFLQQQEAVVVLELAAPASVSFSFDDVELVGLLARVAAACLAERQ
ncbi:MAG: GAF domain-containing protein [Acidimicrobiales bacterium]